MDENKCSGAAGSANRSWTNKLIKALSISVGVPLLILGLGGSIFTILGIIDPAGTQLSNDADPVGTPPTLLSSILVCLVYLVILFAGLFLLWRALRKPSALG